MGFEQARPEAREERVVALRRDSVTEFGGFKHGGEAAEGREVLLMQSEGGEPVERMGEIVDGCALGCNRNEQALFAVVVGDRHGRGVISLQSHAN